jgi:hypothetical protein
LRQETPIVWWSLREVWFPSDLRREAHSVRETVWEREGLKETRPLWPPQRGVGLREPNLGKTNPCVTLHYSLAICFCTISLSRTRFLFLTLTRLVVVFIFVNFSFALFTPPLGDYQIHVLTHGSDLNRPEVMRARITVLPSTHGLSVGYPKSIHGVFFGLVHIT